MSNVRKLHNRTLYRVELDITLRHRIYVDANTKKDLDKEVKYVVDNDMYHLATDHKPVVISYSYTPQYVTCDQSYEEFISEEDSVD